MQKIIKNMQKKLKKLFREKDLWTITIILWALIIFWSLLSFLLYSKGIKQYGAVTGMLILAGGAFTLFALVRERQIFKALTVLLKSHDAPLPGENGEGLIKAVQAILIENQNYKKRLAEQEQDIRYKVFDKLINGSYLTDGEIEEAFKKADITLPQGKIILLLIYISELYSDEKNFSQVKKELTGRLYQITDRYAYIHDMDARKIAVFCFPRDEEEARSIAASLVSKIRTQIEPKILAKLSYGVGSLARSPVAVSASYQNAMEVLRYNMAGYTRECLWYEDLNRDEDTYYYSLSTETKLYDYAVLGNVLEVSRLLEQIYHDNFVKRTISYRGAAGLMGELRSTVLKIYRYMQNTYPESELNIGLPQTEAVADFFKAVHDILEDLCACVNENNKSKAKKTSEKIVEYVDQNFSKSSLSLTDVALNFNLSEKYISSAFKEYIGEKFSVYIETKRIEMACRLISDAKHNVSEIAAEVGYTNDITFRRAFKRRKGVTPTVYAEMVRQEAEK